MRKSDYMIDIISDTLLDVLKLLPFLFIAFFIMEYIEHKFSDKSKKIVIKAGKFGPIIGSLLGAFPQCGFSVAATNFYATKIITVGTLIAIYLSTSDEMLPILLSQGIDLWVIAKIIGLKIAIGMIAGIVIDLFIRKSKKTEDHIHDFCEDEHCDCEHGIIKSTIKHTLNIAFFILVLSFLLNIGIHYLGEDNIKNIFMKDSIFSPFISSLIGLIPNCASSVIITELYLNGTISFGSTMAGLLTGSGVAILVLFKTNKNMKDNIKILLTIYGIGAISGIIIDLLKIMI